jgi:hypothetical protein
MIGIVSYPPDRTVFDELVDASDDRSAIPDRAARNVLAVKWVVGHQADKIIVHQGHIITHGSGTVCPPDDQRRDDITVRRKDGAQIYKILFLVFAVPVTGPCGINCPVGSVHHRIGCARSLAALLGAFEIEPAARTKADNNQTDITILIVFPKIDLSY